MKSSIDKLLIIHIQQKKVKVNNVSSIKKVSTCSNVIVENVFLILK